MEFKELKVNLLRLYNEHIRFHLNKNFGFIKLVREVPIQSGNDVKSFLCRKRYSK